MLPIQKKKAISVILGFKDKPFEKKEEMPEMGDLEAVAQELIDAVHSKDVGGVVSALKAFMEIDEEKDEEKFEEMRG